MSEPLGPNDLGWLERLAYELNVLQSEAFKVYRLGDKQDRSETLEELHGDLKQATGSLSSAARRLDAILDELREQYPHAGRDKKKGKVAQPPPKRKADELSIPTPVANVVQGLVVPVPVYLSPSQRWFSLYVARANENTIADILGSLSNMFEAFGATIILQDGPLWGSFLSRWLLKFKQRRSAQRMMEGMIAHWVGMPQANANNVEADAVAKVMEQAKDPHFGTVAVKFRNTLLLKVTPVEGGPSNVASLQLTPEQVAVLDATPSLMLQPLMLLQRLSEPPDKRPALPG